MRNHRERERLAVLGFYGLAILLAYFLYLLFSPFLVPLAWAAVLVICFYPTHLRCRQVLSRNSAAFVSTLTVAVLVVVPMLLVVSVFVQEARRMLDNVPTLIAEAPAFVERGLDQIVRMPGGQRIDVADLLTDAARRVTTYLSTRAASILQNALLFFVNLAITIFAMFFLFRDAPGILKGIRHLLPLDADLRERILEQTRQLVTASVTSGLIVAAVQGALGGIAFWLLGFSAPVFWGVVMAMFCLLPLGAWIVWGPAAVWLLLTGEITRGLILGGVGAGIVSAADNFLRPMLLSERSEMNGLLLLVSLLGGVGAFGAVGLILGPIIMATAVGLFEAYTSGPAERRLQPRE